MTRPFVKMNGAGNDFVVVNALETPFSPSEDQVRALADRATGEGFDQLIAIEPSDTADAFMRVWNADGSLVQTCGNALRCVGWLLMEANGSDRVVIDTLGGPTVAVRAGDRSVTVDMGRPRLDWTEVPLAEEMDTRGIELQVGPIDDPVLHTPGAVSMGNPHVVFFTDRQDDGFVTGSGSLIEHHPLFPEGVNVGFAHVLAPGLTSVSDGQVRAHVQPGLEQAGAQRVHHDVREHDFRARHQKRRHQRKGGGGRIGRHVDGRPLQKRAPLQRDAAAVLAEHMRLHC